MGNMKMVRHTVSFCTTCYREIPAQVVVSDGSVMMHKSCVAHGATAAEVERDPAFYTYVMGLKSPHIYSGYFVDVTKRCNLRCEFCYYHLETKDPEGEYSQERIIEDCKANVRHGNPFILTGGEPTIRDDIVDFIGNVQRVGPVAMLTNGVRMAKDKKLMREVVAILTDENKLTRLNLSIHADQTDAWREVLEYCRLMGRKIESILIVVDSKDAFGFALDLCRIYKDVVVSFRIKAASRLWNEQKPQKRIFISDMLRWLDESGHSYQFIMPGHNKPTFVNVLVDGMWIMLVSWYDVTNVDLLDIDCAPYYRAKNGAVVNLVTWGLINEGWEKGWVSGQMIPAEDQSLQKYIREQARVADANSHEWQPDQAAGVVDPNAAYRAGMWYAYHDIEKRISTTQRHDGHDPVRLGKTQNRGLTPTTATSAVIMADARMNSAPANALEVCTVP